VSSQISSGFLTPPAVFVLLCLAGALLTLFWRRLGLALALVASLCLYALATPVVSSALLYRIEANLPSTPDFAGAQAIVVLGGDMRIADPPDPDSLGPLTLERVAFGARAYRQLQLPVAVSGGRVRDAQSTFGDLMKAALERDFGVPVRWNEDHSRTTWENATDTARLLGADGIKRVVLVTQPWHLPRSLWSFERAGFQAVPWPVPRTTVQTRRIDDFLPNAGALLDSFHAMHEIIGSLYYWLRY
jgi:uncharacterized SAM-binding protein YcdF (DUF218 family)